jgi:uncharacterized membrane protein
MSASEKSQPEHQEIADVVRRNIQSQQQDRQQDAREQGLVHQLVRAAVAGISSLWFLVGNAILIVLWIMFNTASATSAHACDHYPFPVLSLVASIESIGLTTLVLINQRRSKLLEERQADLNLHVNLLAEHEVTQLLTMVDAIRTHLGITLPPSKDLEQLTRETKPGALMEAIDRQRQATPEKM